MELVSDSAAATRDLGRSLAGVLLPGDVLCLEGPLGTGKTVLVQGLARGLGFEGHVTSPTFTIIHPYADVGLCHVDAFRLSGPGELLGAGMDDYLDGGWICAVEWADRVRAALPAVALRLRLSFGVAEESRRIRLEVEGGTNALALRLAELLGRMNDAH